LEPDTPLTAAPAPLAGIPDVIPAAAKSVPLVDTDFFTEEDLSLDEPEASLSAEPIVEAEVAVEAEIVAEPAAAPDPMSDARFADELMGLVDSLFDSSATTGSAGAADTPEAGQQIVVSPLFAALSVDEMVAVIAGLNLLTFDRGDVIIRQGQPGNSLYMLTSGKVRAFVKKDGKNVPVADLSEGAFFGEGSILTGKPRSATVAALTSCELLELDRPTLDEITSRHPHVMDVMREFAARRLK
ncbi:MAG TPA: cyclic nucleotide-binding domain-containing protein, partial [Vicinamibacteria bacterium]